MASGEEKPKGKGEEQPKRTLKKIEDRVKGLWKSTAPEDGARGQANWGTHEEARSHRTKSGEKDMGTPEPGKDDVISTPTPVVEQDFDQGEKGVLPVFRCWFLSLLCYLHQLEPIFLIRFIVPASLLAGWRQRRGGDRRRLQSTGNHCSFTASSLI